MAKVKITGHASGTGVITVTAPNTSTDRTITLPDSTGTILDNTSTLDATKLSGNLPAISGASLTSVNAINGGRKNMVYNGAMQVAQRGTSATSVSVSSYNVTDRWRFGNTTAGVYTISQSSESPDGFGFSQKLDCTTADASLAAGDGLMIQQRFEGVDLQSIAKGTSSAKQFTVSFYVKTNKTGTYQVNFYDLDNLRLVSGTYTVANTNWNRYTVTFAADTTGAFTSDTNLSAQLEFWLAAGSDYTTGSTSTSWGAASNVNRASSLNVNLSDNTSNEFHITGIQLELGSTATDFEHRSYGEELALCHRYYQSSGTMQYLAVARWQGGAGHGLQWHQFQNEMRAAPTISISGGWTTGSKFTTPTTWDVITTKGAQLEGNVSQELSEVFYAHDGTIYMDAEL